MTWIIELLMAAVISMPAGDALQLNEQGVAASARGDSQGAIAMFNAAREVAGDGPVQAMVVRNLALAYARTGFYSRAERLASDSVQSLTHYFGPNDVSLVPSLNVLGETYVLLGRLTEARRVFQRAVEIGPGAGEHYATGLHNIGAVYHSEGDFAQAAKWYARALDVREELLGPEHPHSLITRNALAAVRGDKGSASLRPHRRSGVSIQ